MSTFSLRSRFSAFGEELPSVGFGHRESVFVPPFTDDVSLSSGSFQVLLCSSLHCYVVLPPFVKLPQHRYFLSAKNVVRKSPHLCAWGGLHASTCMGKEHRVAVLQRFGSLHLTETGPDLSICIHLGLLVCLCVQPNLYLSIHPSDHEFIHENRLYPSMYLYIYIERTAMWCIRNC